MGRLACLDDVAWRSVVDREASEHPETATTWETQRGDLVLMVGRGWPLPTSRCPIHEAESPVDGERVTLTLRHNTGGYGAAYFS